MHTITAGQDDTLRTAGSTWLPDVPHDDDGGIDVARAERAVAELLAALGQDPAQANLRDTPRRVAAAYRELLTPKPFNLTTFPNEEGYDQLIIARQIRFTSLCAHHLLPFTGVASVAYLPRDRILGLSKLARIVESFAHGLQLQERLTAQIAEWLQEHLSPKGVGVLLEAGAPVHEHPRRAAAGGDDGHVGAAGVGPERSSDAPGVPLAGSHPGGLVVVIMVTRRETFSAAHRLFNPAFSEEKNRHVFGLCSNPHGHGHNYVIEVTLRGEPDAATGYLFDLGELSDGDPARRSSTTSTTGT